MTADFQAQTLGAFRGCRHGDAIAYRATLETTGPQAVSAILLAFQRAGLCAPHTEFSGVMDDGATDKPDYYAVLDLVDAEGCVGDNLAIPTQVEFDQLREALKLRVTSSDCDEGCA